MRYPLPVLAALVAAPAFGQPGVETKTLATTPAGEPRPALRYELLPTMRDRVPGNAALAYYRAFAARPTPDREKAAADDKRVTAWDDLPLDRLPAKEVRDYLAAYGPMFRELDRAARSDHCDWEMLDRIRADGIGVVLHEVQPAREVTRALSLRIRLELAENRFDDAARSLRTGFQFARHVGESPTFLQTLVGVALAGVFFDRADEFVGRPGAPNLYWALAALPDPLVDLRPAVEGEAVFFDALFPELKELDRGPVPADRANRAAEELLKRARQAAAEADPGAPDPVGKFGPAGYVGFRHPAARQELIDRGRPAKEVDALAPAQAVVLNAADRARELRDDGWKWIGRPYPEARPGLRKAEERLKAVSADPKEDPLVRLFALALPATDKVTFAAARVQRRAAALRAIEAVRLYAVGGKLPATLADVSAVPVPADPVTGKPFGYVVLRADTFALTAGPPAGEPANPGNALSYEVTVRPR